MFEKAIFRLFSSQYRFPSGFLGRYIGNKMDQLNDPQSDWVVSLLDLQPNDTVLEVGFSTGRVLKKISSIVTKGKLYGLDPSNTMYNVASEKLKGEMQSGQVQLVEGYAEKSMLPDNTFSKIFTVHVVYFWEDLEQVFKEFLRISKSNALVAIYFVSPIIASNKNFHEYTEDEIKETMISSGFRTVRAEHKMFGKQNGVCLVAKK